MKPSIVMHVNYCEQDYYIPDRPFGEMCSRAVDWGFDGIEFRRKRAGVTETAAEYLDIIAEAREKSGLKQVIFGSPGPDLTADNADVRARETKEMAEFYRLAAERFRLTVCNVLSGALLNPDRSIPFMEVARHGSYIASEKHWEWAATGFRELGNLAEKLEFKLGFETHMGFLHDSPLTAARLVDLIGSPAVGVNLDYANAACMPDNRPLQETLEMLGERLCYVHLKNNAALFIGPDRVQTGLADGDINHREYLRLLKDSGYAGPICLEAPRPGDREWYARQDIAYLNSVLNDLAWK